MVNDANVAALAEYHARAEQAGELPRAAAYIKADTGVGGGLVVGGRIHTGTHGMAGEVGHIPLAFDGPDCPCGARGCLAMYVGPEPLTAAAGLADVAARDGVDAALAELDRRLRADDPRATAALAVAGRSVGAAVLAISGLVDPGEVILGGYLATWAAWLTPGIDAVLAGRRAVPPTSNRPSYEAYWARTRPCTEPCEPAERRRWRTRRRCRIWRRGMARRSERGGVVGRLVGGWLADAAWRRTDAAAWVATTGHSMHDRPSA